MGIIGKLLRRRASRKVEAKAIPANHEAERRIALVERIRQYPTMKMTRAEFAALLKANELSLGFLRSYPLSTCFVSNESDVIKGVTVIGQTAEEHDLFSKPCNTKMTVRPQRCIKHYRLQLTED